MNQDNQLQLNPFMKYLASLPPDTAIRLPSLHELSRQLGISVASLREQMEVARVMGLIEVRPRTGIVKRPYTFTDTATMSLMYAVADGQDAFQAFSDLRQHIEAAYWKEAAALLNEDDTVYLQSIVDRAFGRLHNRPPQIPMEEHREFHLSVYRRINNPYVQGILEAYWVMYEKTGMAVYSDLEYLEQVWNYHQQMVKAIRNDRMEAGYQLFMEHLDLISHRVIKDKRHNFE